MHLLIRSSSDRTARETSSKGKCHLPLFNVQGFGAKGQLRPTRAHSDADQANRRHHVALAGGYHINNSVRINNRDRRGHRLSAPECGHGA